MRQVALSLILMFLGVAFLQAQTLRITDTRFYCNSNPNAFNRLNDVIQTADGGYFFVGKSGGVGGGPIPVCPNPGRPLMGKLDSLGNVQWIQHQCDTPVPAGTVCQTPDGGYAINGGTYPWTSMSIFRYNAQGSFLWRKDYGKAALSGTLQIITTPDKGFLVLGAAQGRDSDITVAYSWPPSAFQPYDWVLIKLDSMGNKQWVRTLGTSGDESQARIICDGKAYYLIGMTKSKDFDCNDVAGHPGNTIYTIKLDSAGNKLWSKAHGWGLVNQVIFDDRDNTILATGRVHGAGQEFVGGFGYDDFFLMKLDTAGNYKWGKLYGTAGNDEAYTVCKAPNKGYFIGGYSNTTVPADNPGVLVSVDSIGNQLEWRSYSVGPGGLMFKGLFLSGDRYCALGFTAALTFGEGTGQNCKINDSLGSLTLSLSTLRSVPLRVPEIVQITPSFTIAPNPTAGNAEMRFAASHSEGWIAVTTTGGQTVHRQPVFSRQQVAFLPTADWPRGTYTVCWLPSGAPSQCSTLLCQ